MNAETIAQTCTAHGLVSLAVIDDPGVLPDTGLKNLLSDGVGDMEWLARHQDIRLQPSLLLPDLQRILLVALPYSPEADSNDIKRARYAAGKDYHKLLRKKLTQIGATLCAGYEYRATVDSAPVNERQLAVLAGIGWIGKNALLIHPQHGSFVFIGCLLTTAPLPVFSGPVRQSHCGSCTNCIQRCPTKALLSSSNGNGRVLSTRCISYLTIEHNGVIPRELAEKFNGWWYGCDICQEVCPWNRFALPAGDERLCGNDDEHALLAITQHSFDTVFAGRPIRRIGYERFRRNMLVALWSKQRAADYQPIIDEGLPLVCEQAQELGLALPSKTTE